MIRSASLYTFEIDDLDHALEDIQSQLNNNLTLLKNTAAILHCEPDFIESGVVAHICNALSFPIVGNTTIAQATNASDGVLMLSMLVFTSDDVLFIPVHTEGHSDDFWGSIQNSFLSAQPETSLPLKLILAYPPLFDKYPGDDYINAFQNLCGNVPIFGSVATEDEITIKVHSASICNGVSYTDEFSYLLVYGNVSPRFLISAVPQKSDLFEASVITKASSNILQEIDGLRTIDFFEQISLAKNGVLCDGIEFIPFILSLKKEDGSLSHSFVRAIMNLTEEGFAYCRGIMYENAVFSIGSNAASNIINSSKETTQLLNMESNIHAALIYSCVVRRIALVKTPQIELEIVRQTIRPDIPFMASYAGGELGPTAMNGSEAENRFHNFSFIICIL